MSNSTMVALPDVYLTRPKPFFYYVGQSRIASEGPQGFFAASEPQEVTRSHFHHVDQFQVYFGVPGSNFQRRPIGKVMVHYADSDTVYGPFSAGDDGLNWLTLRRSGADFTGFMPESREHLKAKPRRRHFESDLDEWMREPLPSAGEVTSNEIIDRQDDGLAAYAFSVGPRTTLNGVNPAASGGQYVVVVDGSLIVGDEEFSLYSVAWIEAGETPNIATAGSNGARVLFMQFGRDPS